MLIYYVSHAPKGVEVRYSELKKLVLIMVVTSRRLGPYFLSHRFTVLSNSLFRRVLTNSDLSGRMAKWTIELGEYDIQYEPPTTIKAQALSDFLAETKFPVKEGSWKIFVDGLACKEENGA